MGALRLYDHDFSPEVWLPAAGVPWFVTVFGQDSLIVSLQSMMVHRGLALGACTNISSMCQNSICRQLVSKPAEPRDQSEHAAEKNGMHY